MKITITSYNIEKRNDSYSYLLVTIVFLFLALSSKFSILGFVFIFLSVYNIYRFTRERKIRIPLGLIVPVELLNEIMLMEQKLNDDLDNKHDYKQVLKLAEIETRKLKDRCFLVNEK